MKYEQLHTTDIQGDWRQSLENSRLNFNHLRDIDRIALENGEEGAVLHRFFSLSVADGQVHYQITKVTSRTATVTLCDGICLDEYSDRILGQESKIPISKAKELVRQKDSIIQIFGFG